MKEIDKLCVCRVETMKTLEFSIAIQNMAKYCPGIECEVNGGAMFRRLQYETEVYFRFVEICHEVALLCVDTIEARIGPVLVLWMLGRGTRVFELCRSIGCSLLTIINMTAKLNLGRLA